MLKKIKETNQQYNQRNLKKCVQADWRHIITHNKYWFFRIATCAREYAPIEMS
jgi:hypothetical protein